MEGPAEGPGRGLRADLPRPSSSRSSAPAWTAASRSWSTRAGSTRPGWRPGCARSPARLGLAPKIAHVEGDDLLGRLGELTEAGHALANADTGEPLAKAGVTPVTANAYLGGWGIAAALRAGADVVVCPRVTDASLVVGPAAAWHGWGPADLDPLAGAVVAGHVIECGPQATGGNYSFLAETAGPALSRASRSPRSPPTAAA